MRVTFAIGGMPVLSAIPRTLLTGCCLYVHVSYQLALNAMHQAVKGCTLMLAQIFVHPTAALTHQAWSLSRCLPDAQELGPELAPPASTACGYRSEKEHKASMCQSLELHVNPFFHCSSAVQNSAGLLRMIEQCTTPLRSAVFCRLHPGKPGPPKVHCGIR